MAKDESVADALDALAGFTKMLGLPNITTDLGFMVEWFTAHPEVDAELYAYVEEMNS